MSGEPVLVKVAAAGADALRAQAERLAAFAAENPAADLAGIAWTAGVGRADLFDRAAVVARSVPELAAGLRAVADGTAAGGVVRGRKAAGAARVAFVAPGHGVPVAGLLADVYGRVPAVTETLDALRGDLGLVSGLPLSVLVDRGPAADAALARTEVAQPALYALAVALGRWWRSVGVTPALLLGHSVGAYAAAALAGVFTLEEGARLVAERGRLMGALPPAGAMAMVLSSPEALTGLAEVASGELVIAVYNGPRNAVLSGPRGALDAAVARLAERGIRVIRLPVAHAFHSAEVDAVLAPLADALALARLRTPRSALVSDTSGGIAGTEVTTADYWITHTREPVRFGAGLRTLLEQGVTTLVELGPGSLLPLAASTAAELNLPLRCVATMPDRAAPRRGMLEAVGRLWADGADIDWTKVNPRPEHAERLPTYAFQRTAYWPAPFPGRPAVSTPPARGSAAGTVIAPDTRGPEARPAAPGTADLVAWLRQELSSVMGFGRPEDLDADAGLFDLGLTSAMVVQLRGRLERRIGRQVDATAVFDYPTISRLATFLAAPGPTMPSLPVRRRDTAEPVAIVGMACRFPGGANDLADFWRLLSEGRDAIGEVPPERWDREAFYDPDPAAPGKSVTVRGGFLDVRVDEFDAAAFGISPREARSMDPQQRLLLEVVHEALDDADCTAETLRESVTSVFVGINTTDYLQLLAADGSADFDAYLATGNTFSVAAGRLSYLLGAHGPALAVDTACSSSLVAAHLAVRSLRSGESDVALVAGVNLMLSPGTTISLSKMRALSPDGRCKAFDAAADGYGRGEGCGALVLKRLPDAVAAGDQIWAVLRGTAVNQDGRSAGLTVPNGRAQREVVRAALLDAGVEPGAVSYVEAHGTGTPLGDPVELAALAESLRPDPASAPLVVGSVKTNVGHLEAAAGVCGLIKAALALHHRRIPPHLHFTNPSPHLPWDRLPVTVPTRLTEWEAGGDGRRLAGVSSFGFSGTNAHAIVEEAPEPAAVSWPPPAPPGAAELLVLSAQTAEGRDATAAAYSRFLRSAPVTEGEFAWGDIARTARSRRRHLPERMALVAHSATEGAERLDARRPAAGVRVGRAASPEERPRLVFVYSGQGSQWPGMGRGLLAQPESRAVLEECESIVRELAGWSLISELTARREDSRLDDTVFAQPAIFATQAALTAVWRHWGVTPGAVVGHSVGEIAAAHAAGVLDLAAALRIAVRRGELMGLTRGHGAMAALGLPAETVYELLGPFGGRLSVAAVNSPVSTAVAGDTAALAELEARVRERGAFWTILTPHYAFHSPAMDGARDELVGALAGIPHGSSGIPVFSTVHGREMPSGSFTPAYWADNVRSPVLFSQALRAAAGSRATVVEVGPHAVLTTAVSQSLPERPATVLASMRAGKDPGETMLDAAGGLFVIGHALDHSAFSPPGRQVPLPPRQWARSRHWLPARPGPVGRQAAELDERLARDAYEIVWRPRGPAGVPAGAVRGTWVLLADRGGIAGRVAALLAAAGRACLVHEPEGGSEVDLDGLRAWLAAALRDTPDIAGVVPMGSLDVGPDSQVPGAELDRMLAASCGPMLLAPPLLAGHASRAGRQAPRLWTVTRGGVPAGGAPIVPAQAPAWGLGRVIALEHPDIWGGLIDLDPAVADPAVHAAAIAAELIGADAEDQIAYRGGERLVARLARSPLPPSPAPALDGDGAYLITGGRGVLGLRVAAWLAERGARHLVLLGRRPLPVPGEAPTGDGQGQGVTGALRRLREAGVTVYTPSADVADMTAMAGVFDTAATPWPAIRGVVHAAGVFEPRLIGDMTWERFRAVLRPKVEGTLVLDSLTADRELDFFVMFSSASSVWGSALAGHYAAANHFQDVMAHDRVKRGLPGLAINWGWWSGTGMAAEHADYFRAMGLDTLPEEEGLAAFGRLLGGSSVQLTVAPVDWGRLRPVLEAKRIRPLLADMASDTAATVRAGDAQLRDRLAAAATPAARLTLIEERLQREIAVVLGREAEAALDRDAGFFTAGLDSITSVELKARLEAAFGARLPATVAFEHPTVAALAAFVAAEVSGSTPPEAVPEGDAAGHDRLARALSAELADVPEDELLRLLEEELEDRHGNG